jgi:hypothetical protein
MQDLHRNGLCWPGLPRDSEGPRREDRCHDRQGNINATGPATSASPHHGPFYADPVKSPASGWAHRQRGLPQVGSAQVDRERQSSYAGMKAFKDRLCGSA